MEGETGIMGLLLSLSIPCSIALLLGIFMFYGKVKKFYFTLSTLAIALSLQQLAIDLVEITGGYNGLYGYPPLTSI